MYSIEGHIQSKKRRYQMPFLDKVDKIKSETGMFTTEGTLLKIHTFQEPE